MALKALLAKKKLELKRKEREELRSKRAALQTREEELEAAVEEVTNEEEQAVVQESVDALIEEKKNLEEAADALDEIIKGLEDELAAAEAEQQTEPAAEEPAPEQNSERSVIPMNQTTRAALSGIVTREDVRAYLGEIRACIKEKRAINNVGLTLPEVLLGVLRENVIRYSKLYDHVTVSAVRGEGRTLVADAAQEAVWTECCANLNELTLTFYQNAFGCWKLGGFLAVCNANIEDSDLDLAAEVVEALSRAIGFTDDKTILYGTGSNMPLGIVPRLAQSSKPAGYPSTARPWADLHTSNVKTIANSYTGIALFQQLALAFANAKGSYSRGEKVWVMNELTYSFIVAQAMSIDASGAIASGIQGTMPVIGGVIEVLPDSIVPDYNIVAGYFDLYRVVERAGEKFASSEHFRFLSDQTIFKATVRWDGLPEIAEAFVLIGVNGTAPTTSASFAGDAANAPDSVWLPATATVGVGSTITLTPVLAPYGVKATYTWASGTSAKATVSGGEVTGVSTGSSVITVTTDNGLTAECKVTVSA